MADEASLKSRDEILRKILHEIEEWQWSYDDQTLFVKIHSEKYLISCEVLNRVFSGIGGLESIEKLYHGSQFHSVIRFQNRDSAIRAFECYDGRCIYDGCCRMELFPDGRKKSRWNSAEAPIEDASQAEDFKKLDSSQEFSPMEFSQMELEDSKLDSKLEPQQEKNPEASEEWTNSGLNPSIGAISDCGVVISESIDCVGKPTDSDGDSERKNSRIRLTFKSENLQNRSSGGNSRADRRNKVKELEDSSGEQINSSQELDACKVFDEMSLRRTGAGIGGFGTNSMGSLESFSAQKLFEEITLRRLNFSNATTKEENMFMDGSNGIFDPGGSVSLNLVALDDILGIGHSDLHCSEKYSRNEFVQIVDLKSGEIVTVFDLGKFFEMLAVLIKLHGKFDGSIFVFDPGTVFKESFKLIDRTGSFIFDPGITASLHYCVLCSQSSSLKFFGNWLLVICPWRLNPYLLVICPLRFLVLWLLEISPWTCDANFALPNRTIWMIAWSRRCGFVAIEICELWVQADIRNWSPATEFAQDYGYVTRSIKANQLNQCS